MKRSHKRPTRSKPSSRKATNHRRKSRWSAEVTKHSDALDLQHDVFKSKRPAQDRAFIETLRRREQTAERHTVSIRDVDVEFLHQSCGKKFADKTETDFGKGQAGIARRFWTILIYYPSFNPSPRRATRAFLPRLPAKSSSFRRRYVDKGRRSCRR